jgi:pimeloyl-ACP methyl ester carboxylesterase
VPARVHRPEEGYRTVEANGLRFAYLEWGSGPLLLLLHGFPDTAHTWDALGPELAKAGFRVVAPFSRGYLPTALPPKDADARTLGEDVFSLVAALGERQAAIIGHDWGAESLYAAAGLGPERISRMVTVAIPHRAAVAATPMLLWRLRHFFLLPLPGAEARFARNDFEGVEILCKRWSPTWKPTAAELEPVKNAFAAPGCLSAALGYYRAARVRTPDFLRKQVTVPTLCVAGADDPNVGVDAFEGARRHYAAEYRVVSIPGGHFCHRESPKAFLDAVVPFIQGR